MWSQATANLSRAEVPELGCPNMIENNSASRIFLPFHAFLDSCCFFMFFQTFSSRCFRSLEKRANLYQLPVWDPEMQAHQGDEASACCQDVLVMVFAEEALSCWITPSRYL